jgi:hypothetical protein
MTSSHTDMSQDEAAEHCAGETLSMFEKKYPTAALMWPDRQREIVLLLMQKCFLFGAADGVLRFQRELNKSLSDETGASR